MDPKSAALALHNTVVTALAHHPHKHTSAYYRHQAAQAFASIGKDGGPFHEGDLAIIAVIVLLVIIFTSVRRRRGSN